MSDRLQTAMQMASRTLGTATDNAGRWMGRDVRFLTETDWDVTDVELGADVYAGTAGITTVLGALATMDPSSWSGLALSCAQFTLEAVAAVEEVGWFTGKLGSAASLVQVAAMLGSQSLARSGEAALVEVLGGVEAFSARTKSDELPDLVDGLAGQVLGLLRIADLTSVSSTRRRCVELAGVRAGQLADTAQVRPTGTWWPSAISSEGLASFAHGGSGVGLALVEVGTVLSRSDLVQLGLDGFRHERSWLCAERPGWPDLRSRFGVGGEPSADISIENLVTAVWCHGSAGIGLARLRAYELTGQRFLIGEASAALVAAQRYVAEQAVAAQRGEQLDCTLCHGLSGVAELFLVAHRVTGRVEHLRAACRVADLIELQRSANGRWGSGLPDRSSTPGLFLGDAGVISTLLRLGNPQLLSTPALVR